jgi:hypothetical protein
MARGRWRARALAGLPEKMAFWIFEVRVAAMVRVMWTAGGMKSRRARHRVATEDCNARDRMRSYEISRDRMRSEATAPDRTLPHSTALYRTLSHATARGTRPHATARDRTRPHATARDRTGPHGTARDRTGPHGTANDRKVLTLDTSLQSLEPRTKSVT